MLGWFAETTLVASGLAVVAALASRFRPIGPTARHAPVAGGPDQADDPAPGELALGRAMGQCRPASPLLDGGSRGIDGIPPRCPRRLVPMAPAPDETDVVAAVLPRGEPVSVEEPVEAIGLPRGPVIAWLTLSVLLGLGQGSRIVRFHRRLRSAVPAPNDLVDEANASAGRLGVRVPELLVVPDLGTPIALVPGPAQAPAARDAREVPRPRPLARHPRLTSWPTSAAATTGSAGSSWRPA